MDDDTKMRIRHALYLIVLLATAAFAEGPKYQHKDGNVNLEFQNVYQDIRTKLPIYSTTTFASSTTIATTYLTQSSATATYLNIVSTSSFIPKLGAWASGTFTNATQVSVDSLVLAFVGSTSGSRGELVGYTDASNPPTTIRARSTVQADNQYAFICMPVKAGEYYKVTYVGGSQTIWVIPL